jgi:hypothetical protein
MSLTGLVSQESRLQGLRPQVVVIYRIAASPARSRRARRGYLSRLVVGKSLLSA